MEGRDKETKSIPVDKSREKLLLSFCILSVVGICLTIALFVRTETKFQQIDVALLRDGKSLAYAQDKDSQNLKASQSSNDHVRRSVSANPQVPVTLNKVREEISKLCQAPGTVCGAGAPGPRGPVGPQGTPGIPGDAGEPGVPGEMGLTGAPGAPGEKGEIGEPGLFGPPGTKGEKGAEGYNGQKGDQGDPGTTGPQGPPGEKGEHGPAGPRGAKGLLGERGPKGFPGVPGEKGDRGAPGPRRLKGKPKRKGTKADQRKEGERGVEGCPFGWVGHGESCYYVDDTPTQEWRVARSTCLSLGGDLAIITSAEENQFVFDLIKKQDTFTKLGAWIGIKRKADSRLYWVDDALVEGHYSAWYSGQPDNSWGREGCGHMLGTHRGLGGTWNDLPCFLPSVHYNPVVLCQKPSSFNDVLDQ